MENLTDIFSFVSGTEQEQEKQKSEIEQYCKKRKLIPLNDEGDTNSQQYIKFYSDWEKLKKELKRGATFILTNIELLSNNRDEIIDRIDIIINDYNVHIEVIDKKQFDRMEKNKFSHIRRPYGTQQLVDKILNDEKKES